MSWIASICPGERGTAGAEPGCPSNWIRTGNAVATIDAFARAHDGNAPVFVFADSSGSFNNDTECVNGLRGNAADHLTKEVRPYVVSTFGTSTAASNWAVVGWSAGGTCAIDLAVMHPERRYFALQNQTTAVTAIRTDPFADLYVALGDPSDNGWTIRAYWKPLISWIWGGALVMALGGMVSLSDRRWRVGAARRAPRAAQPAAE